MRFLISTFALSALCAVAVSASSSDSSDSSSATSSTSTSATSSTSSASSSSASPSTAAADKVQVEILHAVECSRKSRKGDQIEVHYRGTLASDGSEFDASYNRNTPLAFTVGLGQVIKGWDENLLDMCVGEKRRLTIPPKFGYGDRAMGPIPAGSTLIFETELMGIKGVEKDEL